LEEKDPPIDSGETRLRLRKFLGKSARKEKSVGININQSTTTLRRKEWEFLGGGTLILKERGGGGGDVGV